MNLALLAGAAMDSYRDTRRQRQEELEREWYRKFQEDMKEFNQWLQEQAEKRAEETHPYTLERLGLENEGLKLDVDFARQANPLRLYALEQENRGRDLDLDFTEKANPLRLKALDQENALRDLDIGFRMRTDPLREEGLRLSNLLSQQEHEQRGQSFEEDMLLKEWERKLAEQRYRQGEELFPVKLQLFQADLAKELEEVAPELPGIGIPLDDAERKKMFLDLYNLLDEYNVGSEYLADVENYEDVLATLLGDYYYTLLSHAQKHGPQEIQVGRGFLGIPKKEFTETYFGRRYKPGTREYSPITSYLKLLRLIP